MSGPTLSLASIPQVCWLPYRYSDSFYIPSRVDDENVAAVDDPTHEQIGTIQAELRRGTKIRVKAGPRAAGFDATEPDTGLIHERSKKAGSHRVA